MDLNRHNFNHNFRILKTRVNKYALYGLLISICAIVIATCAVAYHMNGAITLQGIIAAQKSNIAIWILDLTPFLFAFWGQYVSSTLSYEAGAMVFDQTQELRLQTNMLESQIMHKSLHDALTDLPNRILFLDRLSQALTQARSEQKSLAIFMIDVNNFKEVNDALGHHNGDRLLKQVAIRLTSVVQQPNTVARLGGDEFAVLMPDIKSAQEAITQARKLQKAMETSFSFEGVTLSLNAALGIAIYPTHGTDCDTLIQRADVAMYISKNNNTPYTVYSTKLDKNSPHKLILMGELRLAIENHDLVVHYQPKVNLKTHQVVAVEALVRWQHEQYGLIAPNDFIPLAERTGLIRALNQWVLNHAIAQCAAWQQQGIYLEVSVNLSTVDIGDVDLPETIAGLLAAHEVEPSWLKLEITESAFMHDQQRALEILNQLAGMGVKISIDDFGTGYSSLAYLSKLPIHEVKIDKSFVLHMLNRREDAVIVHTTIDLAHNMSLKVVAEGIEQPEVYDVLLDLACDYGQGFYISKALPANEFKTWLNQLNKTTANDGNKHNFVYQENAERTKLQ
ncbi:MAG: hypothetical protein Tsb005_16440 [Gammaproteobacteria bacterium]